MCLQLCIDHDSISLVASIPSIPQGFGLSSDVIFAKVHVVYIYHHNHTSLSPIGAHVHVHVHVRVHEKKPYLVAPDKLSDPWTALFRA